ncbi:MAG: hypothetical protein LM568_00525 [Desulfurococcaceae archaeon]|nr:hypothetical protein [Desulfurococcaceae archaeon]
MFCHIGLGRAYRRSYEFFLSDVITSSGAKKRFRDIFRVEGFLGYPLRVLVEKFKDSSIYVYRYSCREYYVFPEKFYSLFISVSNLIYALNKYYRGDVEKIFNYIDRVVEMCRDVDQCIEILSKELSYIEDLYVKRVVKGRKALTTRFKRSTERCRDVVEKFFPDLLNPYIRRYENFDELEEFLKKFFSDRVARSYRRFAELRSPILITRDGIILLVKNSQPLDNFSIYIDDCSTTRSYAITKIVGVETLNGYVYRVKWIALLGIDFYTKQLFLHYIPPTLILRKAELCRLWVLGLVDDFGRPLYEDITLIEV